jgi:di/tricarboxylate transporter
MPVPIVALLTLIAIIIVVLAFDWISADVVGLGAMLTLILTGLLPSAQAFAGFGSDTVLLLLGLLILTAALIRTGVVDAIARAVFRRAGGHSHRLLMWVTAPVTALSSFMSNTAATALFVPLTLGLAGRARLSPSALLMPVAFAAILASSVTLIGTSTNIVVSGLLTQYGLPGLGMFELTAVGLPIALAGLAYLWSAGRRLLPRSAAPEGLVDEFGIRPYVSELVIRPDSRLVGKTLAESRIREDYDLTVLQIARSGGETVAGRAQTKLQGGDVMLVEADRERILRIQDVAGVDIHGDIEVTDPTLQTDQIRLAEVIVLPGSPVIGRTLAGVRFRERYGLQVLALHHRGGTLRRRLDRVRLAMGDVLLVQGDRERLNALDEQATFSVVGEVRPARLTVRRAPIAVLAFAGALAAGAANLVPLPVAVLTGAAVVMASRALTPEEAYRAVEWKLLIFIGGMLAVGAAMERTGTARFLADAMVARLGHADPRWLLSAFFALTVLLTQPMSNQAAAVVILPVAVQSALALDLNPRTFAVMIALAASTSFITPLEPACLMVYGPGRYRFVDFVRVGAPLTVLIYLLAILLVPRLWPL